MEDTWWRERSTVTLILIQSLIIALRSGARRLTSLDIIRPVEREEKIKKNSDEREERRARKRDCPMDGVHDGQTN